MDRATMWTNRAGDITTEFHLGQRTLKIWRCYGTDQCAAFVASDFCLISAHQAEEAATAVVISKISVRNYWAARVFRAHSLIVARP